MQCARSGASCGITAIQAIDMRRDENNCQYQTISLFSDEARAGSFTLKVLAAALPGIIPA
jgi:hypothetical protein